MEMGGGGITWVCGHLIDDIFKIRDFISGGGGDSEVWHGGEFGWSALWYVR